MRDAATGVSGAWTVTDRNLGRWACYVFFALSLAYVPAMGAGFVANGNLSAPIRDPYLAVMELLILPLAVTLVVVLAAVHSYARPSGKTFSLAALALGTLAAGITICVHLVLLTVGREASEATLPGYDLLLSWTWPSVIYALDIASWDLCLGSALVLAGLAFSGPGLPTVVRRGLLLSGTLCLAGLLGAALGNMDVRNVGIVGYALVLPVVLLFMARLFSVTPRRPVTPPLGAPADRGHLQAHAGASSRSETQWMD
jgi:hypothetical protein